MTGDVSGVRAVAPRERSGELYQSTTSPSSKRTQEGPYSQRSPLTLSGSPSIARTSSRVIPRDKLGAGVIVPNGRASSSLLVEVAGSVAGGRRTNSQPSAASTTAGNNRTNNGCRHPCRGCFIMAKGGTGATASGTAKRTRVVDPGRRPCSRWNAMAASYWAISRCKLAADAGSTGTEPLRSGCMRATWRRKACLNSGNAQPGRKPSVRYMSRKSVSLAKPAPPPGGDAALSHHTAPSDTLVNRAAFWTQCDDIRNTPFSDAGGLIHA